MKPQNVSLRSCFPTRFHKYLKVITCAISFIFISPAFTQDSKQGGELLWQDQFDGTALEPADGKLSEAATAMAVKGKRIFVAGSVVNEDVGGSFAVRTYDTRTGKLLWQDQFSGTARGSSASDITVWGRRVFVVGSILNSDPPVEGPEDISSAFAVRSYDGKTGELLWQDQFVGTGDGFDFDVDDHANAIAVRGNRVFIVGSIVNQLTVGDFAVRTYDAESGSLLWQDQFDGTASGEDDDEAYAITVKGKRVFVAGSIENEGSFSDFTVRAYDAKTGRLLWQDQANGTANGYDHATDIAAQGQQVFAAGSVVNQDVGSDFTVRAYDARSGRLLWQDQFNGTAGDYDSASDIAVRGKRVLVAGSVVNQDTGRNFTVRAYHAKTGRLLWQDQFNGTAGDYDSASDIAVRGKRVFVAGSVVNQDTGSDFTVRSYDLKTGELLWQDQIDGTEAILDGDRALAIAVRGNRVFTGGTIDNEGTGPDFAIRAYRAR